MKKVLMIAVIALLAVACNKNQSAVKKLDGTWKATSITVSEGAITGDLIGLGLVTSWTTTYNGCKLKDDEFCNATTTVVALGATDTQTSLYKVTGDGTTLEVKDDASSTTIESLEIVELTKTSLKLKQVTDAGTSDESTTEIVMEKQ